LADIVTQTAAVIISSFNNARERTLAEDALRESEERLRIIVESAVDFAIINTDTKGLVETWNSGAQKIFGYTAEEMIGKPTAIIFTEEDQLAGAPEKEMTTAHEKNCAEDERWYRRKGGTRRYVSGTMRPIYNPELTGYLKVARDLTQKKLQEQQKDDFIGIASHELKTPVTSIKAYTELVKEIISEREGKSETQQLMVKLDSQVDRIIKLIHSLLDATIIAEGKLDLSISELNLNELVEERIGDFKLTSDKHQLTFIAGKDVTIHADRERIGEVLNNLISNAIKYSPNGGNITIRIKNTAEGAEVSVEDNGIGIPEEEKVNLFERFSKIKTENTSTFPGLGLGLYISAAIIYQHHGRIWLESKYHEGSTFYFYLPYSS
jgi:PAS domain S-box-containing protein